jgi:predicted nucleotidyltransferase component of viral defense system
VISDGQLRTLARQDGVTAGLAEKNYVNSWILYAIYNSQLKEYLVFKGGTALSKLYFPEIWRFSEDLDFTATTEIDNLREKLEAALSEIETKSGISFEVTSFHEAGDPVEYVQIKVQYDAVLGQRNTTDLDINFNESMEFPVTTHEHGFEDVPEFELPAYSVEEILVEKLRSLYQRARARDYYDIYRLLNQKEFDDRKIAEALRKKAEQRNVELELKKSLSEEEIEDVGDYWDTALDRLVTEKPDFKEVVEKIDDYQMKLAGS